MTTPKRSQRRTTPVVGNSYWRRTFPTAFVLLDLWRAPYSGECLRFAAHRLALLESKGIQHGITGE